MPTAPYITNEEAQANFHDSLLKQIIAFIADIERLPESRKKRQLYFAAEQLKLDLEAADNTLKRELTYDGPPENCYRHYFANCSVALRTCEKFRGESVYESYFGPFVRILLSALGGTYQREREMDLKLASSIQQYSQFKNSLSFAKHDASGTEAHGDSVSDPKPTSPMPK